VIVDKERFKAVGDQPARAREKSIVRPLPDPTPLNFRAVRSSRFKTRKNYALLDGSQRVVKGMPVDAGELDAALVEQIKTKVSLYSLRCGFWSSAHNLMQPSRTRGKCLTRA
jgi:hypothetical protein